MLDVDTDERGFPLSPIGYNIYKDKDLEWLSRNDLSWDDKESCKVKCELWMKMNQERMDKKTKDNWMLVKMDKKRKHIGRMFLRKDKKK